MIGERLKEERKRLGLTQPELAEAAAAAKRTVIDWEKGVSSPTAIQLAALSKRGMDVLYVLTGTRSQDVANQSNVATSRHLPPDEELLLDAYRGLTATARKALLAELLAGGKKPKSKPQQGGIKVSGSGHRVAGRDFNERKE